MRVLLILLGMLWMKGEKPSELIITKQKITVSGQTSFGAFNCDYTQEGLKDTLIFNARGKSNPIRYKIPVREFSCGNFILNKDFRSTLKAQQYPVCEVQVGNLVQKNGEIFCDMTVFLVGKKLEFPELKLQRNGKGLQTQLQLSFERLELEPPSKLGGLVKVEEKLDLQIFLGI
jgi:hypothetical protein